MRKEKILQMSLIFHFLFFSAVGQLATKLIMPLLLNVLNIWVILPKLVFSFGLREIC